MIKLVAILIMAPVGKVLFTCREATCGKNFTDRSNRDRHEKRFNHKPLKRKSKEPLFDDTAKKYKCANPYASDIESAPNQTTELLNESFISNAGNIVETVMTEIENKTYIYEVFE